MKKYEALAVVEIRYFTFAIEALDLMSKAADIEFLTSENYLGGRLVTIIAGGSVSNVTNAVKVVTERCQQKEENPLRMALVITNPHEEIMKFIRPPEQSKLNENNRKNTSPKTKNKEQAVAQNEISQETTEEVQINKNQIDDRNKTQKKSKAVNNVTKR